MEVGWQIMKTEFYNSHSQTSFVVDTNVGSFLSDICTLTKCCQKEVFFYVVPRHGRPLNMAMIIGFISF